MRDAALQRRRPDWHVAVQCTLRADVEGLARVLPRIRNVNAAINDGTLLQIALMAFPGIHVPRPQDDMGERPDFAALVPGLACVRALLDGGADTSKTYCDVPPLAFALVRGIGPALRLLIKRGATWAPFTIQGTARIEWSTLEHFRYAASLLSEDCLQVLNDYRCAGCLQRLATRRCEGCMDVRYCCRDCQKSDWPEHRESCRAGAAREDEYEVSSQPEFGESIRRRFRGASSSARQAPSGGGSFWF
jgi:hypothetical protein